MSSETEMKIKEQLSSLLGENRGAPVIVQMYVSRGNNVHTMLYVNGEQIEATLARGPAIVSHAQPTLVR